jgi:hypothetical protein
MLSNGEVRSWLFRYKLLVGACIGIGVFLILAVSTNNLAYGLGCGTGLGPGFSVAIAVAERHWNRVDPSQRPTD